MTLAAGVLEAQAGTRPLKGMLHGDSIQEAQGATSRANRPLDRLAAKFRTRFDLPGLSAGWFPAGRYYTYGDQFGDPSLPWRYPASGTATSAPNWNITQGFKGIRFTAAGQTRMWQVTGTSVDIHYLRANGQGGGVLNIDLDGTPMGSINTNAAGFQPTQAHHLVFPQRGTYILRLTAASATPCIVDGIMPYDGDEAGGILMYDSSRTGGRSNLISVDNILDGWSGINPDFIVDDQFGTNDFLDAAVLPAVTAANMLARLNKAESLVSEPTLVMMIPWRVQPLLVPNAQGRTYQEYLDPQLEVIEDHPYRENMILLDLEEFYPNAKDQPWHLQDGTHPNDLGYEKIADAIFETLVPTPPGFQTFDGLGNPVEVYIKTASGLEVPIDMFAL